MEKIVKEYYCDICGNQVIKNQLCSNINVLFGHTREGEEIFIRFKHVPTKNNTSNINHICKSCTIKAVEKWIKEQ